MAGHAKWSVEGVCVKGHPVKQKASKNPWENQLKAFAFRIPEKPVWPGVI
jgi:hypothetical protein